MGAVCHVYASRYRDVAHEHVREHIAEHIAREQCEGGCFKRKVFELTLCLYKEVLCHVASGETRKRARQETRGADLRWQEEIVPYQTMETFWPSPVLLSQTQRVGKVTAVTVFQGMGSLTRRALVALPAASAAG